MPNAGLMGVALVHAALVLGGAWVASRRGRPLLGSYVLFMLCIPVFGAAVCWVFAMAQDPAVGSRDHLMRNSERHQELVGTSRSAERIVPLEEAFLINAPQKRRELMMNLLRSDPRKYLDLLLLARFNEDPETAHYATATLTEVQRQMQLEIQQIQTQMQKEPDNEQLYQTYVDKLEEYVQSGLLEGRLLHRQREVLHHTIERMPPHMRNLKLCLLCVRNNLALGLAQEAREQAQAIITRWPGEESGYLAMLEVLVHTRDRQGLLRFRERIAEAPVEWTHAGLERIHYFCGKQDPAQ